MVKEYAHCQYHGKYELAEWNGWSCPKCEKEIYEFGQWRARNKPATKNVKNLLKRAGALK